MQTGNAAFSPPSQHHQYQIPYHPIPVPHDHEVKKQYLALLPPQQIIEICLTFDIHVPQYVKSTIWPPDINAAIAELRETSPSATTDPPIAEDPSKTNGLPAMASLADPSSSSSQPEESPSEPRPPDKQSPMPGPPSIPSREQGGVQPPQPPYAHQPYGYAHLQPTYPHAPYYQHTPPGYPQYPPPYPPYPQIPGGYPQPPPPPVFSQPPNPHFANAPLTHSAQPQDPYANNTSTDDLPSYEEMIVEALLDSDEPEGCAPKDLFTWMASRYPLQSNFRPSASQALQKAFKRGRFQKSSGGKYRLNATWEGGNTSRRTTRRPQTQNQTAMGAAAPTSPFTHAPLIHSHQGSPAPPNQGPQPFQGSTYGYYGHPQPPPGYPGYQQQLPQSTAPPPPQPVAEDGERSSHQGDAADPYEAAHHILTAINYGGLLQLPSENGGGGRKSPVIEKLAVEASNFNALVHAGGGVNHPSGSGNGGHPILGDIASNSANMSSENPRAELQAQLALLAAQLTEFAQIESGEVSSGTQPPLVPLAPVPINLPPATPPPVTNEPPEAVTHHPSVTAQQEEEEDSDDDDMEEVI